MFRMKDVYNCLFFILFSCELCRVILGAKVAAVNFRCSFLLFLSRDLKRANYKNQTPLTQLYKEICCFGMLDADLTDPRKSYARKKLVFI